MLRALFRRYRAAYAGLPSEVWLLSLALFINRAGSMVIAFLTLYLTSQRGMTEAAAGRMFSVYGVGAVCGAYLGGRLAARVGELRLQTYCLIAAGPLFAIVSVWRDWRAIAASLFVLSLVNEAVRPANSAAITRFTTAATRTKAFSLQRLAANLGFSIGPIVGGLLSKVSYTLLFVVDGATTLLAGLVVLHFFRLRPLPPPPEAASGDGAASAATPLNDRSFLAFLGLTLLAMMVFMQFSSTYPLYMRDHFGLDEPRIGFMYAVNTSIIVVFEMLLIDAVRDWPLMRTIAWGSLLSCVGFGILPFGDTAAYAAFAMAVVTIGEMLSFPLSSAYVANRSGPGREAVYLGWYMVVHALAWVLGPGIGAAIYQVNREALWYTALGVAACVFAGFKLLARRSGDQTCASAEPLPAPLPPPAELPLEQLPQHAT